ncbi:MAG: epoxyqueuosine reductase QueH [Bacillota bacterium]|nr:epoxyqueuosine reductase QueH [Bacillota bacterium]
MNIKENYDKQMQKVISSAEGRPSLLLHSCCGPCSTSVIERLADDFDLTVFFYNPNIDDEEEYIKRRDNQVKYIEERYGSENTVKFIEGRYNPEIFLEAAAPMAEIKEGGERCRMCFELRLRETASLAAERNFDFFTTTLTVSPMKNASVINKIGIETGDEYGVKYLVSDFKKRDGYRRSIELSREYGLYRQHFCGCRFSVRETEDDPGQEA